MKQITDEKDRVHYLTEPLGEDGQGVLYATKNPAVIVRESEGRDSDRKIYDDVKLLPLSAIEDIILPAAYLREPAAGYLLNIPKGFVPLKTIMHSDKTTDKEFYNKTGGLKRRLQILINAAKTLAELHGLPVMYGSMSADRIFISKDVKDSSAYLLYSVKMSYAMDFSPDKDADPYTAPEVEQGKGGTIASDAYAFAAMAYDLLSHNETQPALPENVQAFINRAIHQPSVEKRPSLTDFCRLFIETLNGLVTCQKCGKNIHYDVSKCPQCGGPRPKIILASIYDYISEYKIDRGVKVFEFITSRQCFWNVHTENILLRETPKPTIDCMLNISKDKKLHFICKNLMDKEINLNKKPLAPGQSSAVSLPAEKIVISYPLHTNTQRFIEMVMA